MSRVVSSERLQKRFADLIAAFAERVKLSPHPSPSRLAAAGAIVLSLLGASCGQKPLVRHADGGDAMGSGAAGDVREGAGEPGPEVTCTKEIRSEQEGRIQAAAAAAAPCFTGTVAVADGNLAVQALGVAPYSTRLCEGGSRSREWEWCAQVAQAVAGLDASCLCYSESPIAVCLALTVYGGAGTQTRQIADALATCGGPAERDQPFQIDIDDSGRVAGTTGIAADVSDCLVQALQEPRLPCLAGAEVCGSLPGEWVAP